MARIIQEIYAAAMLPAYMIPTYYVALDAAAWFNGTQSAFLTSMYSRRDDKYSMASAGYLVAVLTVCLYLDIYKKPDDILKSIEQQAIN